MKIRLIILALVLSLFSGCAIIDYCDEGGREMVCVQNTGWYFMNFIPIASGDVEHPNTFNFKFFKQTTTLENNIRMLDAEIARRGADYARDVSSSTQDESVFLLLFKRHTIQTSAELVRNPVAAPVVTDNL